MLLRNSFRVRENVFLPSHDSSATNLNLDSLASAILIVIRALLRISRESVLMNHLSSFLPSTPSLLLLHNKHYD